MSIRAIENYEAVGGALFVNHRAREKGKRKESRTDFGESDCAKFRSSLSLWKAFGELKMEIMGKWQEVGRVMGRRQNWLAGLF